MNKNMILVHASEITQLFVRLNIVINITSLFYAMLQKSQVDEFSTAAAT